MGWRGDLAQQLGCCLLFAPFISPKRRKHWASAYCVWARRKGREREVFEREGAIEGKEEIEEKVESAVRVRPSCPVSQSVSVRQASRSGRSVSLSTSVDVRKQGGMGVEWRKKKKTSPICSARFVLAECETQRVTQPETAPTRVLRQSSRTLSS